MNNIKFGSTEPVPFMLSGTYSLPVRLRFFGMLIGDAGVETGNDEYIKNKAMTQIIDVLGKYSGKTTFEEMDELPAKVSKDTTGALRASGIYYNVNIMSFALDDKSKDVIAKLQEAQRFSNLSPEEKARYLEKKIKEAQETSGLSREEVIAQMNAASNLPSGQAVQPQPVQPQVMPVQPIPMQPRMMQPQQQQVQPQPMQPQQVQPQPQSVQPQTMQPQTMQPQPIGMAMPKFCPNCGSPVTVPGKFCGNCGAPFMG